MYSKTKKMVLMAMLCTIAYLVMTVGRIPVVLFLKYDPKDVVITMGGFIFGPIASVLISVVVSFLEMVSVSETGPIGFLMNVVSSCAFACPAAYIYKKKHTMGGAVIGLISAWLISTVVMLLWNYFITPIYMGYPREAVAALLVPAFLPFNLLKGGLNATITMLVYKPVVMALRNAHLLPPSENGQAQKKINVGLVLASALVLATCTMFVMVMRGII